MGRRMGVAVATLAALAVTAPAALAAREPLNAYRVAPTAENKSKLALQGFDMSEADHGSYLEIYGTASQIADLKRDDGISARRVGKPQALSATAAALPPVGSDAAYNVWRRYDRVAGDSKEQYQELYDRLEGKSIVKRVTLGRTHLGRDIVALKVTKNAKATSDNSRPAVLYNALQHAREWLAGETCRRTLLYFTDNYGKDTEAGRIVTPLVDSRELWFLCVANPDGYEYTFTPGNRLWRKNMADNDGDGVYGEVGDGVDPNRNFATNWGRDNEGSSDDPTSETYRGTGPASEPETRAMTRLWNRVDFKFQKNDHTAAELLLYPQGFQQYTPTADNAIFEALAGDDDNAAIADKVFDADAEAWEVTGNRFDPDISAELYITNGDTLDDAYRREGILGFTPEGSESDLPDTSDFIYQDVEADVEAEFQRQRLFSIDLAESASDPGNPVSHMGNTVRDFYVDAFADSYGDPQPVQVTAKRSLGDVSVRYRINDGPVRTAGTREFRGGERYYQERGVFYHRLRGTVRGTSPGDEVEVWFTGGGKSSSHFTYTARRESDANLLVLSSENYTGGVPAQDPSGPHYLTYYTDALDELGVDYEIYDVDRRGNVAPDALGVLSHFDTVIWYTGDDYLTRQPNQMPGTGTARLAVEEMIAVRDFLNEGGKLFYTGKSAGQQYAEGNEFRNFGFPEPTGTPGNAVGTNVYEPQYCNKNGAQIDPPAPEFDEDDPTVSDGCIAHNDDFLQYYLGAYVYAAPGNTFDDAEGHPYPLAGTAGGPFDGLSWSFDETGANNQDHSATFVVTSSILDPATYPLYADSRSVADWLRPGAAPFSPFSGTQYMSAGAHSTAYKRFGKTLDLTGAATPQLTFKFSGDMESEWDWVVVEARDVTTDPNSDDWTTLPEVDTDGAGSADESLTTQSTGESCPEGLATDADAPHPFLLHYWSPTCEPTGTTGDWYAFTGSSGGWTDWTVDLSAYAGKKVDLRISVITDWGTLGLGAWVDDWRLTDGATELEFNDFEQPLDASWQIGPPPAGTNNPTNGWTQRGQEFTEGGVVATDDTLYTGFGFEGINRTARTEFLRRTLVHLGVLDDARAPAPAAGAGQAGAGQVSAGTSKKGRAYAKIKSGRKLRVDRKGRVKVRVRGEGDAGAVASGKLRVLRGKKQYGAKRFSVRAGETKTVAVKLRKSVRKALRSGKTLRATLSARGTDSSGAAIAARQRVRMTA